MLVRVALLVDSGALFVACRHDDPKPAASKQEFERLKREVEKRLAKQKLRARPSAEPMRGANAAPAAIEAQRRRARGRM